MDQGKKEGSVHRVHGRRKHPTYSPQPPANLSAGWVLEMGAAAERCTLKCRERKADTLENPPLT
eukprot:scaffold38014_cov21-Tisochrysis_lutea.AAC.3